MSNKPLLLVFLLSSLDACEGCDGLRSALSTELILLQPKQLVFEFSLLSSNMFSLFLFMPLKLHGICASISLQVLIVCPGWPHLLHFLDLWGPDFTCFCDPFVSTYEGSLISCGFPLLYLSFDCVKGNDIASRRNVRSWIVLIASL